MLGEPAEEVEKLGGLFGRVQNEGALPRLPKAGPGQRRQLLPVLVLQCQASVREARDKQGRGQTEMSVKGAASPPWALARWA